MKPDALIKAGFTFLACMLLQQAANAQIKMSGTAPGLMRGDALLELNSSKQGLLLPRVTSAALAQHPLDTAANGLMVYNTDLNSLFVRTSASWQKVLDANATQVSSVNGTSGAVTLTGSTGLKITGTLFENDGVISFNARKGAVVPADADYTLNLLGDVAISSPATDQLLRHNGTEWANWTPDFLKASATLTQGAVLFAGASGVVTQANTNFFWDNTNSRLGIGNAAPTQPLSVTGNAVVSGNIAIGSTTAPTLPLNVTGDAAVSGNLAAGSTTAATSTMQVSGSLATGIRTVAGNITLNATDYAVIATANAVITLPPANSCPGRIYKIKKASNTTLTIAVTAGDSFDRATGPTSIEVDEVATLTGTGAAGSNTIYQSVTVQAAPGGNIWYVLGF
jgi:hypothetical protein